MKVLYLVGMGRSGSTLTDILLDAHSQIRALGGVRRLAHYARKHPCPCGAPSFWECEFWSAVNARLEERLGCTLETLDVHARDPARFNEHNRTLFEVVSEVSGVPFVTDNSKSVQRLRRLMAAPDIDVIPIHVLRDPRGRAQSLRKRKQQNYIPTFSYSHRSLRLYYLLRNEPHIVLNYEKLAYDPEDQLPKLMARLGLEFERPQLDAWAEMPHHNIGSADVFRKTEGSQIRPDDAWKQVIPPYMQRIQNLIAWPGRVANDAKERRWGID
ncbi:MULTISPECIES: sulfotransferase [unclassified Thioalkalivibrio]|uniref:sulfotransferase family protein n=1 Tax=unclassified Thioalkalivibrio TaxID=2621013 RepID=UPI00035D3CB2|nr:MULTISPECIES: sulfotransferase [unclassified Thioalkalivibrio]